MNRKAILSPLAAALPLAVAVCLAGPAEARRPGPPPQARLEKHLDELGLDAAQMEKVRAILDAAKDQRRAMHKQLRAAFDQMHTLLEQDPPDEAAVMRQAEVIGQLKTEGHKAMLHTLLQVRAELTPEQRKKLMEMKGRHPRWRHHPPDPEDD